MTKVHISIDRLRGRQRRRSPRDGVAGGETCPKCGTHFRGEELVRNARVCTSCAHHFPASARQRLEALADGGDWTELWPELRASDPLQFRDLEPYTGRIAKAESKTDGAPEAISVGRIEVAGQPAIAAAMDFGFLGGSMGSVVGEKLVRASDRAAESGLPLVVITASGGARMQEGLLSLMQMAKISGALQQHQDARLLYMPVLTHPTTGGVTASFAMLGDIILAEPKATIGFAGRRVNSGRRGPSEHLDERENACGKGRGRGYPLPTTSPEGHVR